MDTKSKKIRNLLDLLVVHKKMLVFVFFEEVEFMGPQSDINLFITGMRKMVPRTSPKAYHRIFFRFGKKKKNKDSPAERKKTEKF